MEELTRFGMKDSLTLPSLANKSFYSLGDENDEPTYTYSYGCIKWPVRPSIK